MNGHWIVNVPFNINIKGYRADYIILDEADSYEDIDIYFKHVPARLIPGGKIVLISTREGPTRLFGAIHSRNPSIPYIKTIAIVDKNGNPKKEPYEEGFSIWPERFTIKYLLDLRREIGHNAFEQNFMCNIMTEPEDAIFSIKSIIDSQDRSLGFSDSIDPDAQYFIGADFAISRGPKADMDAFVVIERKDNLMRIKNIEIHKGWTLPSKVNRLIELCETYKSNLTTKVIADESNMGTMVINDLRLNGITVVPQNFHYAERKKLLQTFANILESRQFIIPRAPHDNKCLEMTDLLTEQLLGFMRKQSENTGNENVLSRAAHDDVAISTAMAAVEASRMKSTVFVGASAN
jgi:phage FluMu gp28-like protein